MILNLNIPPDLQCEVMGYLYDSDDPADLGQTMAEVLTASGVLIEVGWQPEGDPDGCYRVDATQGMRVLCKPFKTTDVYDAAKRVEVWARFFSGQPMPGGASSCVTVKASPIYCTDGDVAAPGQGEIITLDAVAS